jgi:hypothetical protein
MWKRILLVLAASLFLSPSLQGVAGDFDGSKPVICAVIETHECGPDENCVKGSAEGIDMPQFFRVNFKDKLITSTRAGGELQTSAIQRMERVDGKLILQGVQNGRAWSAVISEINGKFVLTASADQEAFVLFGACTGGCE